MGYYSLGNQEIQEYRTLVNVKGETKNKNKHTKIFVEVEKPGALQILGQNYVHTVLTFGFDF